jgi:hypothetical protein
MEAPDSHDWSTTYQIISWVGAAIAGAMMWLFGRRATGTGGDDKIADLMQKLARAETETDIGRMREDMQRVLGAMRDAIMNKLDQVEGDLSKRISAVERSVDRLEAKNDR